jgi:glucokinase
MYVKIKRKQYAVGVDIGGTKILLLITDALGNVIYKRKVDSSGDLSVICEMIDSATKEANIAKHEIIGMTIGVPGDVNSIDGIVRSSIQMGWKDINIKEYISSRFCFPVDIKNDVNLAALGERWIGNGRNSDHLIYISIGTGLGGAIIANGRLIEGSTYSAGEFGYIIDKDDINRGVMNGLDQFGSLEKRISGNTLNEKAQKIGLSSKELFVEYNNGNDAAKEIIDCFVRELSVVIANLVSILNPEYVIIGGGVSESMDCIQDLIVDYVKSLTIFSTEIRLSKLGGDAGAFGCIYNVLYQINDSSRIPDSASRG